MPLLIAQLTAFSDDGHAAYRVHGPGRGLARRPGVTVVDCDPGHRHAGWLAEHADVLVLHALHPDFAAVVGRRRSAGRATTFEASDHYFDIQPWSDYSVGWLDRSKQDLFWQLAATVDAVQTSTPALAAVWAAAARRVLVFPNPPPNVPPLPPRPDRPLTVGWAGSATHLPDWFHLAPVVAGWVAARPDARLAVMTDDAARGFVRLPPEKYSFHATGSLAEYATFLRGLDVGVVPLLPSPFNLGRTDLKFRDFAAHGVVGVYAAEGPYPAAVAAGRTGFLFRSPAELVGHLDRLADDPGFLAALRRQAHDEASARRDPGWVDERLAAYRDLLGGHEPAPDLPAGMTAEADIDGRYYRVRPGEPEEVVRAAARSGGDAALLPRLRAVVAGHPGHAVARQAAARTALRAGQAEEALGYLAPLLGARAGVPSVLADAAQVYLALGDAATARGLAERAVGLSPAFAAAWAILSRALDAAGAPDAGRWADRAARNQPRSYVAALAPVKYLGGPDRADRLADVLTRFARDADPEERPYLAAAVARVAAECDARDPLPADLLARACAAFPESARLAGLHAAAQYAAGDAAAAAAEYARARGLARGALAFQLEFTEPPPGPRLWGVAEYAHRHPPAGGPGEEAGGA